ncbi:MAG: S41 family peptidase [Candidatus Saccharicenans sp.]|jgi:carboxyl-terminal processing protease|nr:S41 family peptidase [Candidatus Saccharicenans sp.]MDH7493933.1 S41 family peptidase [Candidatus Saccharicenans sp.]
MAQNSKKLSLIAFLFPLLFLVCRSSVAVDPWQQGLNKVLNLTELVQQGYFEEKDARKLTFNAIKGMLDTLDPHSYFLDPEGSRTFTEDYTGKYYGLGIQIQKQEDRLVVIAPIEGTPAWRLGIQPGDVITHIDGESTKPLSSTEAMLKLRGEKGTKVTITIQREGLDKPFDLTITREEIPLKSVPYAFMLDQEKKIGYIFVRNFGRNTVDELEESLEKLSQQGLDSLILDLRSNTGGPVFQAVDMADLFLPRGTKIVSMRGRNTAYNRDFFASQDNQYEQLPLVILINQGTASASEIVAGAIMDNDRGLIVGEDSWGKGLVQTVFPLAADMAVAITTAKYLTPSGREIQRDYSHLEDYILAKRAPEEKREVKYTAKGRKVLGQGGITPDYEVKTSYKPLTVEFLIRGAFFSYGRKFSQHQTRLSRDYVFPQELKNGTSPSGRKIFDEKFEAGPEVLKDFLEYVETTGIKYDLGKLKEAEAEIRNEIRRELFSAIFSLEEGIKVFRQTDPVVLKAIEVMPEAVRFVKNN